MGEVPLRCNNQHFWLACIFLLLCGSAHAEDALVLEDLENISHEVVYVNSFGKWESEGKHGIYRVVLLDSQNDFPHSKIYLQWIGQDETTGKLVNEVLATVPLVEINNVRVYKLSIPRIITADDKSTVEVTAINQYSQEVQNLQILPTSFGRYELSYVSRPTTEVVDQVVTKIPLTLEYYVRPTF